MTNQGPERRFAGEVVQDAQVIGVAPDISEDTFVAFLREQQSPALPGARAIYRYCEDRNVSPAFIAGMFEHESQCGTVGTATETRSWGNTRLPNFGVNYQGPTVPGRSGEFPVFKNWVDGGISTVARLVEHAPYRGKTMVREIIRTWAPASDLNSPSAYATAVLARMADLRGRSAPPGGTMVPKPPMVSNPAVNRGGYSESIHKESVCWHVTSGTNSLGWLTGSTSGVSSNFLIDADGTIRELVPWQEAAWVQGIVNTPDLTNPLIAKWMRDGNNPNVRATGIECEGLGKCGEPGGLRPAQAGSLIALTAWLCQVQGHPCDRTHILRHSQLDSVNRPCCPGFNEQTEMLPWIAQAARLLAGGATRDSFAAWWQVGGTFGVRWRGLRGAKGVTG